MKSSFIACGQLAERDANEIDRLSLVARRGRLPEIGLCVAPAAELGCAISAQSVNLSAVSLTPECLGVIIECFGPRSAGKPQPAALGDDAPADRATADRFGQVGLSLLGSAEYAEHHAPQVAGVVTVRIQVKDLAAKRQQILENLFVGFFAPITPAAQIETNRPPVPPIVGFEGNRGEQPAA